MKTIKITLLILISFITLEAQEQRRDYPRPLNEVEYVDIENIKIESIQILPKLKDTINITWQKLNGPYGGIIGGFIAKGDTILVSTGYYKDIIFYSTNRGLTWNRSNFKNSSSITDFLFTNYGSIIAAAGKSGLYESKDLINWDKVTLKNIPSNLDILFLGKDFNGGIYFTARDIKKIYYSNDSLKTWKVDFDRDSLYIMNYILVDNGDLYAGGYHKIFVKRKDSTSWVECSPGYYSNLGYNLAQDELGNIYAGSGNRSEFFESRDSGKTWIDKDTANFLHQLYYRDLTYNNGTLITAGWPDYMLSGWGVAISKDKGSTWKYSNEGLLPYSYASRLATSGEDTYLGMYGGGIYRSTNQGEDWHPWMTGLAGASVNQIAFDKNNNLYAALWGGGIQKSTDQGNTWQNLNNGLGISNMYSVVADDSGYIYAGGGDDVKRGTYRSTDGGNFWNEVSDIYSYELKTDDKGRIYSLSYRMGLYRSDDRGLSWELLINGVEDYLCWGFTYDKEGGLYLGAGKGVIYKSTDDGNSWFVVRRSDVVSPSLSDLEIDKEGNLYAAITNEGIIKSTNYGLTWEKVDSSLTNIDELAINSKGEIIASSKGEAQIFYSKDKGITWYNITGNITNNVFDYLAIDNFDNIYLASDEESIWKGSLPLSVEDNRHEQEVTDYSLSQNYPNPFNPSTTINFALPEASYVTLKIYNTLGEEVTTLVNEYKQTGNHQVSFNAKDLSSGLYIYKLNTGGKTFSKKMMFLK